MKSALPLLSGWFLSNGNEKATVLSKPKTRTCKTLLIVTCKQVISSEIMIMEWTNQYNSHRYIARTFIVIPFAESLFSKFIRQRYRWHMHIVRDKTYKCVFWYLIDIIQLVFEHYQLLQKSDWVERIFLLYYRLELLFFEVHLNRLPKIIYSVCIEVMMST